MKFAVAVTFPWAYVEIQGSVKENSTISYKSLWRIYLFFIAQNDYLIFFINPNISNHGVYNKMFSNWIPGISKQNNNRTNSGQPVQQIDQSALIKQILSKIEERIDN